MRYIYILVLNVLVGRVVCASKKMPNSVFAEVKNLYQLKQYDNLCSLYEKDEKKGHAAWYNLGNCLCKRGDYPQAIACWRRAIKQAAFGQEADCVYNTCVARKALAVEQESVGIDGLLYSIPLLPIQLLTLIVWYMPFFICFKRRKWFTHCAYGVLFIFTTGMVLVKYQDLCAVTGIVVKDGAPMFVGPDARHHKIGMLSAGHEVLVCDHKNGWCRVRQGNVGGWILESAIHPV